MAMKTTRAQELRSKPKPRTVAPDFWAFLEEIDAPQWVDLALQGNSNGERDDSWFDTLHPFHQRSFQDLVSPGVKVKGRGYVSAGKLSSCKSHSNDSLGANSGFYKPSNSTEVECFTTVSTSSDNESRNPMVGKSESSRASDLQNRPIVPQHTTAMPRSNGLVASLKSINLRRSGGALPALRVEVKGQQQSRNGRSSASKFNTVDEKSRKDCESANAKNKTALVKMKTKTVLTAKLSPGQSIEDRKRGDLSMQIETVSRPPLRDVNSVSNPLYKSVTGQYHGSAAAGKENDTLCTTLHQRGHMRERMKPAAAGKENDTLCSTLHQRGHMRERMKPLRSIKHGAYNHVFNGKRILGVDTFA